MTTQKNLRRAALGALVGLGLASTLSTAAMAGPVVCAHQPEDRMTFSVSFNANWENGLKLVNTDSGQVLQTFNNFVGRGAGSEWNRNGGNWTFEVFDEPCVEIQAVHKAGVANPSLPWSNSRSRSQGSGRFGFEDGGDSDFNDVRVRVRVRSLDGSVSAPITR